MTSMSIENLDQVYSSPDPWGVQTSPDDANRKKIILAVLDRFIRDFRDSKPFKCALDIGCGEGWITQDLPATKIMGYDLSKNALARCPKKVETISDPKSLNGQFDLIVGAGILVKQYDYDSMLRMMREFGSDLVLSCQTDITEVTEIARYKNLEFFNMKFKYRDNNQILRLFNFGDKEKNNYEGFKLTPENYNIKLDDKNKKQNEKQKTKNGIKVPEAPKKKEVAPSKELTKALSDLESLPVKIGKHVSQSLKKDSDLPTIGYLCMSCDPIDMMNAICDFRNQDWPNKKKKLYILKQRTGIGQFPPPLKNNLGLQIIERDVDGYPWPELWTFKFIDYLSVCDCEYTLWFDEDDRYPPDYTKKCMEPILAGQGEMSWSWDCIIAEYDVETETFQFRECWYRSPVGQMAVKTEILKKYGDRLWKYLYSGTFKSPKRLRGVPYGGAQDDQLRQLLQKEIETIPHHRAQRVYFIHGQANSAQLRPRGNAIDYRGERGSEGEKGYDQGRFNQARG